MKSLEMSLSNSSEVDVSLPKLGHLTTDNAYDSPDSSETDSTPNEKQVVELVKEQSGNIKIRHQFQDVGVFQLLFVKLILTIFSSDFAV